MSFDENNPIEYFQNAQVNLENLARMVPELAKHPIFLIAKSQLENGIEKLESEEAVEVLEREGEVWRPPMNELKKKAEMIFGDMHGDDTWTEEDLEWNTHVLTQALREVRREAILECAKIAENHKSLWETEKPNKEFSGKIITIILAASKEMNFGIADAILALNEADKGKE